MTDDPGVMGNLPRSRPGRRSEKRAAEVKPARGKRTGSSGAKGAARKATGSASAAKAGGAKAKATAPRAKAAGSKSRATGSKPRAVGSKPRAAGGRARGPAATTPSAGLGEASGARAPRTAVREERLETPQGSDPITAALRLGMAVGDAGLKAVAKIAERLPRP